MQFETNCHQTREQDQIIVSSKILLQTIKVEANKFARAQGTTDDTYSENRTDKQYKCEIKVIYLKEVYEIEI